MTLNSRLRRVPLRVRLVAGFVGVMTVLLAGAGAFVYWRVQVDLDNRLNADLAARAASAQQAWSGGQNPARVVAALPPEGLGQVLAPDGTVLARTSAAAGVTLLPAKDLPAARSSLLDVSPGNVLTGGKRRLRVLTLPLDRAVGQPPDIAVIAVRLGQRDEALRELLAQLAVANVTALAVASAFGYRLTRAALLPVERYRAQAEQVAGGAAGVRLDVPDGVDDEVSRLGHTLNRMLTAQEQTAAQQRQFLADASHELRAPLTVLTSEVELALRRPRTPAEYEQTLQQVALDTARLVALADQILDLEQGNRAGRDTGSSTDAAAAAERAAVRARSRLVDSGRDVTLEPSAAPVMVPFTATALDQVLGNLTDNAVIHGRGTVTVTVRTAAADQADGSVVMLAVSDDGPGPPTEFIPHALERFRRADPARSTPGNGLGLALVHSLVAHPGGELRLCSNGSHHRYPPLAYDRVPCAHPDQGMHVSVIINRSAASPGAPEL